MKIKEKLCYTFVIIIFAILIILALCFTTSNPRYDMILNSSNLLATAFFNTIYISLITLVGALIFGFVLFVMMRSKIVLVRAISNVFNEIIMGTPLLVMIFLVVYAVGVAIGYNDKLVLGVWALILYNSPYIANAYESTSAVVDSDQYVVMDLYHFKWYEKYLYVIIPQMVFPFIPSLINNLSSVIKSSALLNIVAISEITYIVTAIASKSYTFTEGYFVMWIMYLIVTIPLSLIAKYVARRMSK